MESGSTPSKPVKSKNLYFITADTVVIKNTEDMPLNIL